MNEPKQVLAARKMVEEAEEQTRLQKEADSATPNPDTPVVVEPVTTPEPVVIPPVVDKTVLNWEEEYKSLHERHGKLEARFNVMKGKYDSEVPILHGEIRTLRADNEALKTKGETDTPALPGIETDISPENIQKLYGQELVDHLAAKDKVTADRIKQLEEKLSGYDKTTQDNAEAGFYGALAKAHPDWKTLNNTDAFLGFLKEYLPAMGMTRQEIVDNAGNVGNPDPIINQLTEFKAHTADGNSMTSQVVPEDGGGSPPPADNKKRMIPESEIKEFYKTASTRIANDLSPETAKEVKLLDQEYDDAMREGRILVGQ